jgi:hypothetical protein
VRRLPVVFAMFAALLALVAACGGSTDDASTPTTEPLAANKIAAGEPADPAKMICEPQATTAIARVVGVDAKISTPTWKDAIYACDYDYPGDATMTLSVKQLGSVDAVNAYYDKLASDLGKQEELESRGFSIGEGSFTTADGSVVTRKDNFVLLVDVGELPDQFGAPPDTRENVAVNVAVTVMECWVGV